MEAQPPSPVNPYDVLSIIHNSDDTLTRLVPIPSTIASQENGQSIISKDITLNPTNKTWVRLFLPIQQTLSNSGKLKLPLVLYFRGGGFVLCSVANTFFHNFCTSLATNLPALILSVEYRLAPESRLPAAYDDVIEAINWVRNQGLDVHGGEEWLRKYGDFSKFFLMGCSSGGNMAYHAGMHALGLDIKPLKIQGLILNQPFFGGTKRTESELRLVNDQKIPLAVSDLMWELALPKGVDRDHKYSNPMVHDDDDQEKIELMKGCSWFVSMRGGDPLMDRQMEFVRMLEKKDVKVVKWFDDEGYHGMELFEPQKAEELLVALKNFIHSEALE